jgi:hypothetical protein
MQVEEPHSQRQVGHAASAKQKSCWLVEKETLMALKLVIISQG